jgi:hypothetical protein
MLLKQEVHRYKKLYNTREKEGKCDFTQKFVIVSKKYGCIVNVSKT